MSGEGSSSDLPQSWKPIGVMPAEMGEDVASYIHLKKFTDHLQGHYITVSQGRPRTAFPHSSTCQKVIDQGECRNHERGNIRGETSVLLCLFRNFTNTVVSFSCQGAKTCTSG
jgi:hypothetical protein